MFKSPPSNLVADVLGVKCTDIHNYEERLKKAIENVKKCNRISPRNKTLMLKFMEYKRAHGTSAGRCAKTLWTLKQFAMGDYEKRRRRARNFTIMKDFGLLTKEDIQREFAKLESSSLKDSTKRDLKVIVRFFIGWVFHEQSGSQESYDPKEHGYPVIFKGIKIKEPGETVKASDLLSSEEKQRIMDASKNLRDKALLGCLDESGMRPGELLSLKVGNVTIEEQYGELSLQGKTGIRPAFIVRNLAYLVQWLDSYDRRDDSDAPLWPDFEKPSEFLSYAGLRQMLKRLAERAKIKKRIYPYIYRHTQATSDAVELTEPIMRNVYGWSPKSSTPSRYEHLSGKDTKLAKLRQAGIVIEEGTRRIRLCPRCKKPNPAEATMCHSCGSVMSVKLAVEIQKDRDKLVRDVEELKETIAHLVSMNMKVGQSREDVLQLVASRQQLMEKLPKKYVVEE